jgi:hypothetical protein
MRLPFTVLLPLTGLVFACPQPQQVLSAVKSLGVPITEVKEIKPCSKIPHLCKAIGVIKKGDIQKEVDFYTTADGKYLIPFLGKIEYQPSPVKGLKVIKITSVRNSKHSFVLGYITEDGKYYSPELVPLPAPEKEKKPAPSREEKETDGNPKGVKEVKGKPQEVERENQTPSQ